MDVTSTFSHLAVHSPNGQSTRVAKPMPPDSGPNRPLTWRLRCAYHLAEHATERPIEHEDRVVARVANIFADCRDGRDDMEVTDVHLGIKEAADIAATHSLERDILEARLLAQQYPFDIAARSRFSQYTIAAYGSLYFDVGGQQGVQRWLGGTPHGMPFMPLLNLTLGGALKVLADRNGSEALEDAVEVVCGLAGPTLADGLPDTGSLDGQRELRIRLDLAKLILPPLREGGCLLDRLLDVPLDDEQSSDMTEEEIEETMKILSLVKLSKSMLREIEQLRRHASPAPETTSAT